MKLPPCSACLLVFFVTSSAQHLTSCCPGAIEPGDSPLLVGAFNVQVFGQSKIGKENVSRVLVKVLSRYDVILIQEIRDSRKTAFPRLIEMLNEATGNSFEFETGKRVGRTSSKEQYGFVYRKSKVEVKGMYQREDEFDVFEREPLVVRFRRVDNAGRQREFTFIPLHAKPSDAIEEMNNLIPVYEESSRYYGADAIIAGDLNADCTYICKSCWGDVIMSSDNRFKWLIGDDVDTTTSSTDCAYDRIILAGRSMQDNSCCASVFRFDLEYELDDELTKQVSDHFPVQFTLL